MRIYLHFTNLLSRKQIIIITVITSIPTAPCNIMFVCKSIHYATMRTNTIIHV